MTWTPHASSALQSDGCSRSWARVNGTAYPVSLDPHMSLLRAIRDVLGLTGSKEGCGRFQVRDGPKGALLDGVMDRLADAAILLASASGRWVEGWNPRRSSDSRWQRPPAPYRWPRKTGSPLWGCRQGQSEGSATYSEFFRWPSPLG